MDENSEFSDPFPKTTPRRGLRESLSNFFDKMGHQLSTVKVPKMVFHRSRISMTRIDISQTQGIEGTSVFMKNIKSIHSQFELSDKILGRGKFGVTRIATCKLTKEKYACKTIAKSKIKEENEIKMLQNEVAIMHVLRGHENIIEIYDVYEDKENVHIIMELCTGGQLFDSIVERGALSEYDASSILRSMIKVIAYCHDNYIIHRDLKPENFLFSHKGPGAKLKAIDFGISQFTKEDEQLSDLVGSLYYMAPEVIRKNYSFESDIWSAGVILYILLCGEPPFKGNTNIETFKAILDWELDFTGDTWEKISEAAKNCIRKMLERNPKKRATAREILEDPWLIETGNAPKNFLDNAILEKMKNFSKCNKLKRVALKLIAENLPEKETEGLRRIFQQIDTDKSGTITLQELKDAMKKKNQTIREFELYKLVQAADLTQKGELNYEEFLAANLQIRKLDSDENILKAFDFLDTDKNGYLSRDEIVDALKSKDMTYEEIDDILHQVDINGDGRIDFPEFRAMICSNI